MTVKRTKLVNVNEILTLHFRCRISHSLSVDFDVASGYLERFGLVPVVDCLQDDDCTLLFLAGEGSSTQEIGNQRNSLTYGEYAVVDVRPGRQNGIAVMNPV